MTATTGFPRKVRGSLQASITRPSAEALTHLLRPQCIHIHTQFITARRISPPHSARAVMMAVSRLAPAYLFTLSLPSMESIFLWLREPAAACTATFAFHPMAQPTFPMKDARMQEASAGRALPFPLITD